MSATPSDLQAVLRNRRVAGVALLVAATLGVGLEARNERALFLTQGPGALPGAFVAQVLPSVVSFPGRGGRGGGVGGGRGVGGPGPVGGPVGGVPGVGGPGADGPLLAFADPIGAVGPLPGGFGGPNGPLVAGNNGGSLVTPNAPAGPGGGGTLPGGGGTLPGGGGNNPGGGGTVVPPVPEPGTWAMLIGGFAMLAIALRRGRRGRPTRSPRETLHP
ncbi:PEPxxWA-CTERM sorting domain-containing protein [Sphingomonas profundi]|uniref:PEPxxWA-CTERM sorting domain-containing protein n=1 Tax=Alterirhizorhabdus profundi TaxID=2681549 RepID=UPI0012E7FB79|nr:PEPxxWA-CTERM sorting domain-containing protein [Sphingomonas profundi]